jgi:hypothetical protein
MSNIVLISYPSGGFGNFLFHALTEYADSTYKPDNSEFNFSKTGNSHTTTKYTNVYFKDPTDYVLVVPDQSKKTLVLCDNGINNDSYTKINQVFDNAKIVRTVIDTDIRPVIYQTCIVKAKESDLVTETQDRVLNNWIDCNEDYAIRENFTLFYHNWNFGWEPVADYNVLNVSLEQLITDPVACLTRLIEQLGCRVVKNDMLEQFCHQWQTSNQQYFDVYWHWKRIDSALGNNINLNINNITSLHDQGYINYCIERKFNVKIPVYDYRYWFVDTSQILQMVSQIIHDTNKKSNS